METNGGGWAVRTLIGSLAVLLPVATWAAVTVRPAPESTVVAGATSVGGASLLDEEPPAPAPATTLATVATTTTLPPATSTTRPPSTSTTRPRAARPPAPATTTTTKDLPAFMKTNPNPPGYLPAATSWEAKADGMSVRMRIDPTTPVAGEPVRILLDYTGVRACCILEVRFGDGSPSYFANNNPPCVAGGTLSPGAHSTVVTHVYEEPRPHRAQVRLLDGDLCTLPSLPQPGDEKLLQHIEMFACIAVGPDTPLTPGCDPLPTYGPYYPQ